MSVSKFPMKPKIVIRSTILLKSYFSNIDITPRVSFTIKHIMNDIPHKRKSDAGNETSCYHKVGQGKIILH